MMSTTRARRGKPPLLELSSNDVSLLQGCLADARRNYALSASTQAHIARLYERLNAHYDAMGAWEEAGR